MEELASHPGKVASSTLPNEWRGATPIEQMLQVVSGGNTTVVDSHGETEVLAGVRRSSPTSVHVQHNTAHPSDPLLFGTI